MHNIRDFAGQGNFTWFIGVVEDRDDPLKLGRVRVRCIGWHSANKQDVPTGDLPWALPISPVNGGANGGKGPVEGTWVCGFFMDGAKAMRPILFGTIPGIDAEKPDPNQGFSDPKGIWPRFVGESSVSRLGRNDEGYEDAVLTHKVEQALENIGEWTFNVGGWGGAITGIIGSAVSSISSAPGSTGTNVNTALSNASAALSGEAPGLLDSLTGQNSLVSLQQIRRVITEVGPLVGMKPSSATNVLMGLDAFELGVTMTTLKPEQIEHAAKNLVSDQVIGALKTCNTSQIKHFFKNITPSEINRILVSSAAAERTTVMTTMNPADRTIVLSRMNPADRGNIFDGLSKDQTTEILYGMTETGLQKVLKGVKTKDSSRIVGALGPAAIKAVESIIAGKGVPAELITINNILQTAALINPKLAKTVQIATTLADIFKVDLTKPLNLLPEGMRSEVTSFLTKAFPFPLPPPMPIGGQIGNQWNENQPAYRAQYPYNDVKQTESGHVIEIDDTPGEERIQIYHRAGTFVEIDKEGTVNIKGKKDKFEIWAGHNFCNVKGSVNLTIDGSCETYIAGDWNVKVGGNKTEIVGGNRRVEVSGDYTEIIMGGKQEEVIRSSAELVLGTKSLHVVLPYTETMYSTHISNVIGLRSATIGASDSTIVAGYSTLAVGAYQSTTVVGYQETSVGAYQGITVAGYQATIIGGYQDTSVGLYKSITVGGYMSTTVVAAVDMTVGASVSTKVAGIMSTTAGGAMSITAGAAISIAAGGIATVSAALILLN